MENKPLHYDGSVPNSDNIKNEETNNENFKLTDEMRKSISGNPYIIY